MHTTQLARLGYDTEAMGLVPGLDYVPDPAVTEDGVITDFVHRSFLQLAQLDEMGGVSVLGGSHDRHYGSVSRWRTGSTSSRQLSTSATMRSSSVFASSSLRGESVTSPATHRRPDGYNCRAFLLPRYYWIVTNNSAGGTPSPCASRTMTSNVGLRIPLSKPEMYVLSIST